MKVVVNDRDVQTLVAMLRKLDLEPAETSEEFKYENPVLVLLDAVLSIRRKYYAFVVPRVKGFEQDFPQVQNLKQLLDLISVSSIEGFCRVWNYNHESRVLILRDLALRFISYADDLKEKSDLDAMKHWASNCSVSEHKSFGVKGIGLATYQYLRMMLGVPTVKPDVHIRRAVSTAIEKKVNDIYAIELIERASEELGHPAILIDNYLWKKYAASATK